MRRRTRCIIIIQEVDMKIFSSYIREMYRPSYIALRICLALVLLSLVLLAIGMREDQLAGYADIAGKYIGAIEDTVLGGSVLCSLALTVDARERRGK